MIIAPSVLSLDYTRMEEQVQDLNSSGAEWIHFDVMDGHFVPNLTFGPDILKAFCRMSDLYMDVHLMVTDPVFFADVFLQAGANHITFHLETVEEADKIRALAAHIHEKGATAGLSINPGTPVETLKPYLADFDLFLLMSVQPGFSGQKFQPAVIEKVRTLRGWLNEAGLEKTHIEIDGGINAETAVPLKEAGADVLVAGSYVFKNDIAEAVKSLVR